MYPLVKVFGVGMQYLTIKKCIPLIPLLLGVQHMMLTVEFDGMQNPMLHRALHVGKLVVTQLVCTGSSTRKLPVAM